MLPIETPMAGSFLIWNAAGGSSGDVFEDLSTSKDGGAERKAIGDGRAREAGSRAHPHAETTFRVVK